MHRYTIFLFLVLGLIWGGVRAWAQGTPPNPTPTGEPIIVTNPPPQMITGSQEWQPTGLEPANPQGLDIPFAINAASDSCTNATTINIPGGDVTNITNPAFTQEASDRTLGCMWGAPTSNTGYRTAWYKFTAVSSGAISIDTFGSNYDTVLAVWQDISAEDVLDPCLNSARDLQGVACVDDSRGFTSNTTITVRQGETYYIEVADWEAAAPSPKTLQITALKEPIASNWTLKTPMPVAVSRHATAVAGSNIYVIGGQKDELGTVDITNALRRYNTVTNQWATLQSMPGSGYSNTTAAFVDGPNDNGRIYLPSGYTGAETYDMTHWAYDIQGSYWLTRTALTGTQPFAWATAVADPSVPGYYLIGGLESTEPFSATAPIKSEMYLYTPDAGGGTWDDSFTAMPIPRYAHTAALVNGEICVAGGISPGNVLEPTARCYVNDAWRSNVADLNIPRYAATSAVGLDGRWYVIGGVDGNGEAIAETEVYDMDTNTWTLLPVNYDLGGSASLPARGWPRGGAVGSTFYAIGGNIMAENQPQQPLALVESIFLPAHEILLPVIFKNLTDFNRPDDNFSQARPMAFNIPQVRNFDNIEDYFDVYYFDLAALTPVTVRLTQIPSDSNYDVFVYNANKFLWGKGDSVFNGVSETVPLTLPAGRYYVVVKRIPSVTPLNTAAYSIVVNK